MVIDAWVIEQKFLPIKAGDEVSKMICFTLFNGANELANELLP